MRLWDRVDVTDFGAWQAPRSEDLSLQVEPCNGILNSSRCSADVRRSIFMIMDGGNADAREIDEVPLLGLRSELLNRRSFLVGSAIGLGALGLAGCATSDDMGFAEASKLYGPVPDKRFPIPAVDVSKVDPKYYRRTVRYDTKEAPGTIIVDPGNHYVYRIEGDGNATRYGANVSRDGFLWSGDAYVGRKAEWPTWDAAEGDDPAPARGGQICRGHARRSGQSARRPHALSLSERRLHALHDL